MNIMKLSKTKPQLKLGEIHVLSVNAAGNQAHEHLTSRSGSGEASRLQIM